MALIDVDAEDLEVLVEATLNNRKLGMELLNVLRVANGKPAHPRNYSRGDLNNIHASDWGAALDNVRAACA